MIHWDDVSEPDNLVWVERTVRLLIPKAALHTGIEVELAQAETVDMMSSSQIGSPYRCACGQTGIDTLDFPWGSHRYGRNDQPTRYCPHCDGGEDV